MGSSPKIPRLARDSSREHLHGLAVHYKAEADVLSGRACAEEQADGAGPCGACRDCLHQRIWQLEAGLVHISRVLLEKWNIPVAEQSELAMFAHMVVDGSAHAPKEDYERAKELRKR